MTEPRSNDRYRRQIRVGSFGAQGQERLCAARVGIVGQGALGSRMAEELGRAGVGYLRLIDRDWVEVSNLHRQHLFDDEDARREEPKALAAATRLAAINPTIEVEAQVCDLSAHNVDELLRDLDLLIDGTDNFQTRYLINDWCRREHKPWIYGACIASEAMAAAFVPEGPCLRCSFPAPPPSEAVQTCESAGVLPQAPGQVTVWQTALAMRLLSAKEDAPEKTPHSILFRADLWKLESQALKLPRQPSASCPCCARKEYPALDTAQVPEASSLCGRNAVQLSAPSGPAPSLDALESKLAGSGRIQRSKALLRLDIPEGRITVFRGGRAIVQGTEDPGRARALYDRYLGS
ncbi:MAG: thiamine biosynthesis protein ThiF [Planctomycetota bacterium]|nr:MAG: thiamine biosynthesis protein ThiF [Planctomycetota bacterium]